MVMCIPAVRAAQQNQNSPCAGRRVRSDHGLSSAKALELAAKKKQQQRRVSAPARLQRLPRPAPALPSRAVLEAVDPALADVPTDYIRDMLAETGASLYAAASSASVTLPSSGLPAELEIILADAAAPAPTHLLAVHSPLAGTLGATPTKVALYPVHDLVLAATCTRLPSLRQRLRSDTITAVPVQSLRLPSPSAFPLLLAYLYTRRADALLAGLLARRDGRVDVRGAAARTHGVWQDAAALGVADERLWDTLDLAWTAVSAGAARKA